MKIAPALRVAVYADQASRVEFTRPENSAIIREFQRAASNIHLTLPDAAAVRSGAAFADEPHVFVLPGIFGERSYYPDHLGEAGNRNIRDFIARGGVYMGFCAGAYYAASSILYTPHEGPAKSRTENILGIVSAQAYGPMPGYCLPSGAPRTLSPEGLHEVEPIAVTLSDGTGMYMAYGLGPAFRFAASDDAIRVMARYTDIENQPPAILDAQYGRGRVLLYGALPQYSYDFIGARQVPPRLIHLRDMLYRSRAPLRRFWKAQLQSVVQHHGLHA